MARPRLKVPRPLNRWVSQRATVASGTREGTSAAMATTPPCLTGGSRFLLVGCGWWQNHVCTRRLLACIYGPYSQDLPLGAALVRGCTSAGTRPVASMVHPPKLTGAAVTLVSSGRICPNVLHLGRRARPVLSLLVLAVLHCLHCPPNACGRGQNLSASTVFWPL